MGVGGGASLKKGTQMVGKWAGQAASPEEPFSSPFSNQREVTAWKTPNTG